MVQRISDTVKSAVSPLHYSGAHGVFLKTPSANVANFLNISRKTHCQNLRMVEPVAVLFNLLYHGSWQWIAKSIILMHTACRTINHLVVIVLLMRHHVITRKGQKRYPP